MKDEKTISKTLRRAANPTNETVLFDFLIIATTTVGKVKAIIPAGTPCVKVDTFLRRAGVFFMNQ